MMFGMLELSGLRVFGIETETCLWIYLPACLFVLCSEVMSCLCLLVCFEGKRMRNREIAAVTRGGLHSPYAYELCGSIKNEQTSSLCLIAGCKVFERTFFYI